MIRTAQVTRQRASAYHGLLSIVLGFVLVLAAQLVPRSPASVITEILSSGGAGTDRQATQFCDDEFLEEDEESRESEQEEPWQISSLAMPGNPWIASADSLFEESFSTSLHNIHRRSRAPPT